MVTVRDVAQAAGVSISTVSRALSAPEMVAASTRDRVAAIAARLGYQPNRAAAGLRAGRTGALGLLVPDLANPYFAVVAKGVAEQARTHGLGVFVVDSDEDPAAEVEVLRSLVHQTDGVILASPRAVAADLAEVGGKPVVVVNQDGPLTVASDVTTGVGLALDHLRGLGHRRIAYVGGPATSWSDARRRIALDAAVRTNAAGVTPWDVVALGAYVPTADGGVMAADEVIASGATAVITFNDVVAVGLIRAVQRRGMRVPEDLSVVGWDDTFLAALATPALTSIGTDLRGLGARATELLVGRLVGGPGAASAGPGVDGGTAPAVVLPDTLAVRESTATAPTARPGAVEHRAPARHSGH